MTVEKNKEAVGGGSAVYHSKPDPRKIVKTVLFSWKSNSHTPTCMLEYENIIVLTGDLRSPDLKQEIFSEDVQDESIYIKYSNFSIYLQHLIVMALQLNA